MCVKTANLRSALSLMSQEIAFLQFIQVETAIVVFFWRRFLDMEVVCFQIFGSKSIKFWPPLAKFVFVKRKHIGPAVF